MHNFCDFFSHYGEKRGNGDAPQWAFGGGTGFAGVAPERVLAWAGVLLLAGIPPEKLPASRA